MGGRLPEDEEEEEMGDLLNGTQNGSGLNGSALNCTPEDETQSESRPCTSMPGPAHGACHCLGPCHSAWLEGVPCPGRWWRGSPLGIPQLRLHFMCDMHMGMST